MCEVKRSKVKVTQLSNGTGRQVDMTASSKKKSVLDHRHLGFFDSKETVINFINILCREINILCCQKIQNGGGPEPAFLLTTTACFYVVIIQGVISSVCDCVCVCGDCVSACYKEKRLEPSAAKLA